jgi:hypothetical protein
MTEEHRPGVPAEEGRRPCGRELKGEGDDGGTYTSGLGGVWGGGGLLANLLDCSNKIRWFGIFKRGYKLEIC